MKKLHRILGDYLHAVADEHETITDLYAYFSRYSILTGIIGLILGFILGRL